MTIRTQFLAAVFAVSAVMGTPDARAATDSASKECIIERTHNSLVRDMDCFKRRHKNIYEEELRQYEPKVSADGSTCNVHKCDADSYELRLKDPDKYLGHLDYFGRQGQEDPGIDTFQGCMDAATFLKDYVHRHKPVLMKGCLNETGVPQKWTDEYFRSIPEVMSWQPIVETQKIVSRNDRGPHILNMTFGEFLDRYQADPFYVINGITPERLRKDLRIPKPMQCLRTLRQIDDFHIWFSSGSTESSQHFDTHDNLLGMVDGNKQVLMTDPIYSLNLYMDYHDKFGLSPINVRHVDLSVYPMVKDIPIIEVNITKGDILFIPTHWWHQVNSFKTDTRNLALSMGWNGLFPVGEVSDNFGYSQKGLKEFLDVPTSDGLFALELIGWSKKIRNLSYIHHTLTKDQVCGGTLADDISLAEVPVLEDQYWHMYGMGYLDLRSSEEFFTRFLMPNARDVRKAVELGLELKHYPQICDIKVTWAFKTRAFVTDFAGRSGDANDADDANHNNNNENNNNNNINDSSIALPTITEHSLDDPALLDYDLVVFVKNDAKFLEYLNTEWPQKEDLQQDLILQKAIKVAVKRTLNAEQRRHGPSTAIRAFHKCVSQLQRSASLARFLIESHSPPTESSSLNDQTCSADETCKGAQTPGMKGNFFTALAK